MIFSNRTTGDARCWPMNKIPLRCWWSRRRPDRGHHASGFQVVQKASSGLARPSRIVESAIHPSALCLNLIPLTPPIFISERPRLRCTLFLQIDGTARVTRLGSVRAFYSLFPSVRYVLVYIVSVDGRASRKNIRPFLVVGATTMGQEGTYVRDIGRHPVPTANRTFYLSLHLSLYPTSLCRAPLALHVASLG